MVGNYSIALIHCGNINIANSEDRRQKNMFFMPMGLFVLASELKKINIDVEIIHLDLESHKKLEDIIDFERIDAVGFDCHWANQALSVIETANLIKKIKPKIFVFLGGYTASYFALEIIQNYPSIDAVVKGDGEVSIVELCKVISHSKSVNIQPIFDRIPNLVWRNAQQAPETNEIFHVATSESMSKLKYADITLLRNWKFYRDLSRFWTRFPEINSQPLFLLEVGRGCKYNCSYCGGSAIAQTCISNRGRMVLRAVDSVISTIETACSYGYSMFYTCYEELKLSEQWFIDLFTRIRQKGIKISFGYGSWKLPSKELIDIISDSCIHAIFEISPETSSEELRRMNKDQRLFYSNYELEQCLYYIGTKRNCKVQVYFGYFMPDDTIVTIENTMEYIENLTRKYGNFMETKYSNLSTDPGSLMFVDPDKYGIDIEVRTFADYLRAIKEYYVENKNLTTVDMTMFRPKQMTKVEAYNASRMVLGLDLIKNSRLNILTPLNEIIADKKGNEVVRHYLKDKIKLLQQKQFGRTNLFMLSTSFPVELTRSTLKNISSEFEKI